MSFEPQYPVTRNPVISDIEITMFRTTDEDHSEGPRSMRFGITVDDQFGQPMNHLHGNLIPHLTDNIKQQLLAFMDWIWAKAQTEVTPNE